jgi:hypothetical protein
VARKTRVALPGGNRGTKRPFLWLPAVAVLFGLVIPGCSSGYQSTDSSSEPSSQPSEQNVPWADAPTDGQWPSSSYDRAPFGQLTPTPPGGAFTEYQFAISEPPQLTTNDGGKTVTMTSKVTVHRVEDRGFGEGLAKSQSFIFTPGATAPENQLDESHGTHTTVTCQNDRPQTGETTGCELSFTAPASEIPNSHWTINRWNVGTWPSQL